MMRRFGLFLTAGTVGVLCQVFLFSPDSPVGTVAAQGPPDMIKGVDVQARGPIHEAFATPTAEAKPTYGVPKRPPAPIEEMPPDEKPEGDAIWIGGYWAWDDDRADFMWISGCWRIRPHGREWAPGYWREVANQWQWVPGFWNAVPDHKTAEVTYYPEPPPPPQLAVPPAPAEPDMFYVPGHWMWVGDHYVWRAGYYTRVRSGHVYVASHYRWTPFGFVFVAGYWDFAIARRGVLYAPVVVDVAVVGPRFVYTPYYAVSDAIIVDAFFVRPGFCHYYFGDYYGPRYAAVGFECGYHYSRRHYDPVVVYSRWEYRNTPGWYDARISITVERNFGRAPVPPRTLVQQNNVTIVNNKTVINNTKVYNTTVLAPTKTVVATRGEKTVALDHTARMNVKETSATFQKHAINERSKVELAPRGNTPSTKPHTAALNLPTGPAHPARDPHELKATNVQKKLDTTDHKGVLPVNTKSVGEPHKGKATDKARTDTQTPEKKGPMVSTPPMPPDRPPAAKKSAEEKKKKGG